MRDLKKTDQKPSSESPQPRKPDEVVLNLVKQAPHITTPTALAALIEAGLFGLILMHPNWDIKRFGVILVIIPLIATVSHLTKAHGKRTQYILGCIAFFQLVIIFKLLADIFREQSPRTVANSNMAILRSSNIVDQTQKKVGGIPSDMPYNSEPLGNTDSNSAANQDHISTLRSQNIEAENNVTAQDALQRIWVVPRSVRRNVRETEKTSHPEGVVDHYGWDGKERLPDCPASTPWVVDGYILDKTPSSHRWYVDSPWKVIGMGTNRPLLYSTNMSATTPVHGRVVAGTLYSPLNSDKYTVVLCDFFLRDPSDRSLEALTSTPMDPLQNIQDVRQMHTELLMLMQIIQSSAYQGLTNNSPKEWVIDYANHITP